MALIVTFRNISNLADVSDYEVKAFLNETPIASFTVKNHVRSQGAAALLQLAYWAWPKEEGKSGKRKR